MSKEAKTAPETPSSLKMKAVTEISGITILPQCYFCHLKTKDVCMIKNKWACNKCNILHMYLEENK